MRSGLQRNSNEKMLSLNVKLRARQQKVLRVFNTVIRWAHRVNCVPKIKGAGSRNVGKLLSKRRFCSIFDRLCYGDFPLLFSKLKYYFGDGLLYFVEKQTKHSYVVRLRRYLWILEVTLVWIHPIHRNLRRTQWPRAGNGVSGRVAYKVFVR